MAKGSDQQHRASRRPRNWWTRTWISTARSISVRIQQQHVHQRTAVQAPAHPPAGGSGHWRRQKRISARNPDLQRRAPSGALVIHLGAGPQIMLARPIGGQRLAPGRRGEIRCRPQGRGPASLSSMGLRNSRAQTSAEAGFPGRPSTSPAASAAEPGRLAGPHGNLAHQHFKPELHQRRPRHDHGRPPMRRRPPPAGRCRASPSSAARAMAATSSFATARRWAAPPQLATRPAMP